MFKKTAIFLLFFYVLVVMINVPASFGLSDDEAEHKARELHALASRDVIFIDEELKALYYQNIQIVGLLREIKQLLANTLSELEASAQRLELLREIKQLLGKTLNEFEASAQRLEELEKKD